MKLKISPCLWFNGQAEDAARFYIGIFPDSKITAISYYSEAGQEHHGCAPGSVLTVDFELNGQSFLGLNGQSNFQFSEAISFVIACDTQDEIDFYWEKLSTGEGQCGWLKDKFGVSWQVVPAIVSTLITDPDPAKRDRVIAAIMQMQKLDLTALQRAFDGQ